MRTGIELIKLVLHASGPDAAALLTAGMPVAPGPDASSPADSLQQWRMVAARVGLTPEQCAALADWRTRFLHRIDDCYGRRLLQKAQLAQLPGAGGSQWVEALLLQAAESVGYSGALLRLPCCLGCALLQAAGCVAHSHMQLFSTAIGGGKQDKHLQLIRSCVSLLIPWSFHLLFVPRPHLSLRLASIPRCYACSLCAGVRSAGRPGVAAGAECGGGAGRRLRLDGRAAGWPADQGGPQGWGWLGQWPPAPAKLAAHVWQGRRPSAHLQVCTAVAMSHLPTCLPACLQVQAARFLLAGHPFCWNGLSFAHAVASIEPAAPQPQAQQAALPAALPGFPLPQLQSAAPATQPDMSLQLQGQLQAPAALQKQLAELLAACATGT